MGKSGISLDEQRIVIVVILVEFYSFRSREKELSIYLYEIHVNLQTTIRKKMSFRELRQRGTACVFVITFWIAMYESH